MKGTLKTELKLPLALVLSFEEYFVVKLLWTEIYITEKIHEGINHAQASSVKIRNSRIFYH